MNKVSLLFVLVTAMLCGSSQLVAAEDAALVDSARPQAGAARDEWVPPGFETLNEPQVMEVDIWYGGYFIASSLARFTFEELRFLEPETFIPQIPNLNDAGEIQRLLSQALPTNSGLGCRSEFEIDCGTLRPEGVGIIFDRSSFRAALFIGPENLSVTDSGASRYLPDSSASFSAYSENNLYFSGGAEQETAFNLSNETQIALAENRLVLRNNWTDTEGFVFDTIGVQREYRGKNISLGLIRGDAPGFEFINSEQFVGVSLESSLTTRSDLDQSYGNEISLFFSSRSLVEIYRDSRLLYSGYYDVGNHLLETSSLPSGSYEIEIRITDIGGNTSTERRFYSKSARLAPMDQALYFLQVGNLVGSDASGLIPEQLGKIARAGYSKRLSPTLGAGLGISGSEDSSLVELSMFKLGKNFELSSGIAYENNDTLGVSAEIRFNFDAFDLDLSARQVVNGEPRLQSVDRDFESGQLGRGWNEYRANLSFQVPLGRLNLFYRNYRRDPLPGTSVQAIDGELDSFAGDFNNRNYGIRWNYGGRKLGRGQLRASAELSRNNNESLFMLGLSYNFWGKKSQYSVSPRYTGGTDETGKRFAKFEGSSNANWRLGNDGQHRVNIRGYSQGQNMLEANILTTAFNSANDVTARYDLGTNRLSYNGSLSSTVATTRGASAFGNSQNGESAFLIDINSIEGDQTEYEVLVSGAPRGKTRAGETLLVPVAPYETYSVEVVARGDTLINLKDNNFIKTVYPGNVIALEWTAKMVKVGYGRILDAAGQPLADAVITGAGAVSTTDRLGFFQIEIGQDDALLEVRKDSASCRVSFGQARTEKLVVPLGDLSCL